MPLPPGQRARTDFPRFGLNQFADRFPERGPIRVEICQGSAPVGALTARDLSALERVDQVSDLHCVTTWSAVDLAWAGWRFRQVWEALIAPTLAPGTTWLVLKCADGFRTRLPLDDALASDAILADTLDGEPLSMLHGGPLRFVVPQHYGYKNAKHITRLECWSAPPPWKSPTPLRFMEHPRGRVGPEERGTAVPGIVLRWLYRPLVGTTVRRFERAWQAHHSGSDEAS